MQLPSQVEVSGPTLSTEQVQGAPAVLERQRERGLRPRLSCRTPQHLDEPNALRVVGQPTSADADVARGLEQPVVALLDQPPTDSQMCLAGGVVGQADPRRLGHPVMAEAVSGVATDRVGDPSAAAVDGLKQTQLEARPERLGHHVGRLRGRCRGVVQVELATETRQRTQHRPILRTQLAEVAAEKLGGRGSDLERREDAQVPTGAPTRPDRGERAFALSAVQQLTNLQRIASGPEVEFGGHVAQLHTLAGHRSE